MLALRKHSTALHAFVQKLQEGSNALSVIGAGIFIAIQLLLILLLSTADAVLYLAGFVVIIGLVQVFVRYPRVWIYTIVLGSLVYLTFESPEINVIEILFGIFFLGGIAIWFCWETLVRKSKIIHNAGDWLLIFFVITSISNVIIAALNNIEPISWLREWNVLLLLLYYFPIRKYFTTFSHIKNLVFCSSILVIGLCIFLFYKYYLIISQGVVYAYQYQAGGASTIEAIFMAATIFGIFATIFIPTGRKRLWAILFTGITIGTLLITFRRTYWLVTIGCILLAIPFLRIRYQRRLVLYSLLATGFVLISAFTIIGSRGSQLFFKVAVKRFESVSKGTKDISLYARYMENQEALQQIKEHPLSGSGMRSPIAFYEPILGHTKHNAHIHNGYIGSFHKIGIPLTIIFLLPFAYFLLKGFTNIRNSNHLPHLIKIIAFGSFFTLVGIFFSNITLTQFTPRSSLLIISFCIAFIEITRNYREKMLAQPSDLSS